MFKNSIKASSVSKAGLTLLTVVLFVVLVLPSVSAKAEDDDPNAPVGTMTVTDSKTRTTNTTGSGGGQETHDWVAGVDHSTDGDGVVDDSDGDDVVIDCSAANEASVKAITNMYNQMYLYIADGYTVEGVAATGSTSVTYSIVLKYASTGSYSIVYKSSGKELDRGVMNQLIPLTTKYVVKKGGSIDLARGSTLLGLKNSFIAAALRVNECEKEKLESTIDAKGPIK